MIGVIAVGTVDSETQVTCKFSKGVPVSNSAMSPILVFKSTGDAF